MKLKNDIDRASVRVSVLTLQQYVLLVALTSFSSTIYVYASTHCRIQQPTELEKL